MFDFIDNIRYVLLEEFIDILEFLSIGSLSLYDKITENLTSILRKQFGKGRRKDKFLV